MICRQKGKPQVLETTSPLCALPDICSIPPVNDPEGSRTEQVQDLSFLHTRKGSSRLQLFRGRLGHDDLRLSLQAAGTGVFYKSLKYEATVLCLNSWQAGRCGTADQVTHAVVLLPCTNAALSACSRPGISQLASRRPWSQVPC